MLQKPLFSIIIPVYNIEKYIAQCIESVINQDFNNYELILVDDGSKDKSAEICDLYDAKDSHVKVVHKKNGGVSSARELGANVANGIYLFFIDGDDWIGNGCLNEVAKAIENTDADIIYYGQQIDNGERFDKANLLCREGFYSKKDLEKEIYPILIQGKDVTYFPPGLAGKVIKRELFLNNYLMDSRVTIGEDGACVIPCLFHANSMFVIDKYFYFYRYNAMSATKSKKIFNWEWPKLVAIHIKEKIEISTFDFEQQLNRKILHDVFSVAVTQFYQEKKYSTISKEIKSQLTDTFYADAIKGASFNGSLKAKIMELAIKRKWIILIYIYSKLK